MAIVLPQQFLGLLIRNHGQIATLFNVLPEVLTRLKLPEHCQDVVVGIRRSEGEDPVAVTCRIDESHHVQLRVVRDVDEILWRELRQQPVLAGVDSHDPVCSTIARLSEASAKVGIGQNSGDLEAWLVLSDRRPERFLGFCFARCVDICTDECLFSIRSYD